MVLKSIFLEKQLKNLYLKQFSKDQNKDFLYQYIIGLVEKWAMSFFKSLNPRLVRGFFFPAGIDAGAVCHDLAPETPPTHDSDQSELSVDESGSSGPGRPDSSDDLRPIRPRKGIDRYVRPDGQVRERGTI